MDFDEFEQLVLRVLFETDVAITAAHVAYLGRISVRTAERHYDFVFHNGLDDWMDAVSERRGIWENRVRMADGE